MLCDGYKNNIYLNVLDAQRERNIQSIKDQIVRKNSSCPWLASKQDALSTITDHDNFPYNRWFRGEYDDWKPHIAEREAGFRPRVDNCYASPCGVRDGSCGYKAFMQYPNHCFETAPSTVFPCMPRFQAKHTDKAEMEITLNRECIPQFR